MPLTKQQESFALMYHSLPEKPGRGPRAAVAVGYAEASAHVKASKLLAHPGVKARLQELALAAAGGIPLAPPAHPSTTGTLPFPPAGADHTYVPETADGSADPFEGKKYDDPKVWLREAMNNSRIEMKHRIDAAKKLMDFEHGKIGEQGKKAAKDEKAAETTAASKYRPAAAPTKLRVA